MSEYSERIPAHKSALWMGNNTPLPHLILELTERCNNNCIHCCVNLPAGEPSALSRELPAEEFKRILRQAADLGCLEVQFTGGEPLLREDFEDLYLFARHLGLKVQLLTNARLITPHLADLFTRIPPRLSIEITVYGMKAESYDKIAQVRGAYAQYSHGIRLLQERNIPFAVSGVVMPLNRSEMGELESWASGIPWMQGPPTYTMAFDLRTRRDDPEKNRQIERIRGSAEDLLAVSNRRPEPELRSWMQFCLKTMGPPGNRLFLCAGKAGRGVDAFGHYRACMSLCAPEWTCDLRENSLYDAVNSLNSRIRDAQSADPEYRRRCACCFIHALCDQCPAKSWTENGTLDRPVEYFCTAAHVQARAWGLIQPEEKAWNVADWKDRVEKWRLRNALRRNCHGKEKKMVSAKADCIGEDQS
jgi:MoaA/NifB/PqqE/SkfB family radical SAM enzyme